MPNPLSRVRANASVRFDPAAMGERPELAVLVARVIAAWAEIESRLASLSVRMLGAKAEPALAMFEALTSAPAQMAVIDAAARTALPARDKELFDAVLVLVRSSAAQRHDLAHCQWGYSEALEDALLLVASKHMARFELKQRQPPQAKDQSGPRYASDDLYDEIQVYQRTDFESIISCMNISLHYLFQLVLLIDPEYPWPDRIRDYLSGKPDIQAKLCQIRKGSQRTPKSP